MFNFLSKYQLILGSGSPRRSELLSKMGLSFKVLVSDIDETVPDHLATEMVPNYLANIKCEAIIPLMQHSPYVILTADTIVVKDNTILGKPKDTSEAIDMLWQLSGSVHEVISGFHLRTSCGRKLSRKAHAHVRFKQFTEAEIQYYVQSCQVLDKAGAYGIQDWLGLIGINEIRGSYYTIMGLPTHLVYQCLVSLDQEISAEIAD